METEENSFFPSVAEFLLVSCQTSCRAQNRKIWQQKCFTTFKTFVMCKTEKVRPVPVRQFMRAIILALKAKLFFLQRCRPTRKKLLLEVNNDGEECYLQGKVDYYHAHQDTLNSLNINFGIDAHSLLGHNRALRSTWTTLRYFPNNFLSISVLINSIQTIDVPAYTWATHVHGESLLWRSCATCAYPSHMRPFDIAFRVPIASSSSLDRTRKHSFDAIVGTSARTLLSLWGALHLASIHGKFMETCPTQVEYCHQETNQSNSFEALACPHNSSWSWYDNRQYVSGILWLLFCVHTIHLLVWTNVRKKVKAWWRVVGYSPIS